MKILVVSAHPDPASLTNALRRAAVDQLESDGHEVRVTDLYAEGWKSAIDRADFPILPDAARLRVPA
ncbi:MAG: flavodoxin family protein, partial [Methylobacterium sp.]